MKKIAIYSRKSKFTGKGDSIENQIEMCKNHIKTFISEKVEFIIYEDEGFSGGNINRPRFKELMTDVKNNKLDLLICYRLDRISRNVADFSSVLEILQENKVDFISIKEQFDTSSPMGRAMIYIASVFAQLERETIAERIKDNMLEMAKNGKWTGGKVPFGLISEKIITLDESNKKRETSILKHNLKNIKTVELLYTKYLELGSLYKLEVYCYEHNICSNSGKIFDKSSLKVILQNPIYVKADSLVIDYFEANGWTVYGDIDNKKSLLTYNKTESKTKNGKIIKTLKDKKDRFVSISNIDGYLDSKLWLKVQLQFEKNKDTFPRLGKTHNALLTGKLICGNCGHRMLILHGRVSKKTNEKSFYYVCSLKKDSQRSLCNCKNVKVDEVDNIVLNSLEKLSEQKDIIMESLKINYKNISNNKSELLHFEEALKDKTLKIDVLVDKLSNDVDNMLNDILLPKIYKLKKECDQLNANIIKLKKEKINNESNSLELSFLDSILSKCKIIKTLNNIEQKNIINALIDTIYYYPSNDGGGDYEIKIDFINSLKNINIENFNSDIKRQFKKLSFNSYSMTCI